MKTAIASDDDNPRKRMAAAITRRIQNRLAQEIELALFANPNDMETFRMYLHRYLKAVYGPEYVYRAPESLDSALERLMVYIMNGSHIMAESVMKTIEQHHGKKDKSGQ